MLYSALFILAVSWAFGIIGILEHPELPLPVVEIIFSLGVAWGGLLIIHQRKAIPVLRSSLRNTDRGSISDWRLLTCAGLAILINLGMGLAVFQIYSPERNATQVYHKLSATVSGCNPFTNIATGEVIQLDPYAHTIFRLKNGNKDGVYGRVLIDERSTRIFFTVNGIDETLLLKEGPFGDLCLLAESPISDATLAKTWLGQTPPDDGE